MGRRASTGLDGNSMGIQRQQTMWRHVEGGGAPAAPKWLIRAGGQSCGAVPVPIAVVTITAVARFQLPPSPRLPRPSRHPPTVATTTVVAATVATTIIAAATGSSFAVTTVAATTVAAATVAATAAAAA